MTTRRDKKGFLTGFISVAFLAVLSACAHTDGPYRGRVVELDTEKPVESAVVAAKWTINPHIAPERLCDAKETVTDKNGDFELPEGRCYCQPFADIEKPVLVVFKPGYLVYPPAAADQDGRKAGATGNAGKESGKNNEYRIIKLGKPAVNEKRELTYISEKFSDEKTREKVPVLFRMLDEEERNLKSPDTKNEE